MSAATIDAFATVDWENSEEVDSGTLTSEIEGQFTCFRSLGTDLSRLSELSLTAPHKNSIDNKVLSKI